MQPAAERFWTALEQHSGIALSEGPRQLSHAELRRGGRHRLPDWCRQPVQRALRLPRPPRGLLQRQPDAVTPVHDGT